MAPRSSTRPLARHTRLRRIGGLVAILGLVASACNATASNPPSSSGASASAAATAAPASPTPAGPKTDTSELVIAVDNLGSQLYAPWLSGQENRIVAMSVGDTLTMVDPTTKKAVPALAESWELSPDLKTWDFKLRPDVPFQDGYGTVTSDDVKFSFEQWLNPDSVHGVVGVQVTRAFDNDINNFEVVSPLEFKLHTVNPVVSLPFILSDAAQSITIQSKKYFDEKPDEALVHPLGTGPFKFVSNSPGVEVILEAVDSHPFRSVSAFKKVTLKEIPDAAARLAQVQGGAVDLALLDPSLVGEASAANLGIITSDEVESCAITLGGYYLGTPALDRNAPWIQADAPEKGLAIREAMSLAIDRQAIFDRLVAGYGSLTYGPIINYPHNPLLTDPSWTPPPFDLTLAKQKLVEGGYPNGFPVTFRNWEQLPTAEAITDMWTELGLQVKYEVTEQALMRPLFQASNKPEGNSATNGLAWIFCSSGQPSPEMALPNAWMKIGNNKEAFNPLIDEAYEKMNAEPDEIKRYQIARDLITTLRNDMSPIPLFVPSYPWVNGPDVGGWTPVPGLNAMAGIETVTPSNP